jgi:trans-aconitate 2-methyltransferase
MTAAPTSPSWDPQLYRRYADERARPFHDLVGQVPTADPRDVVDLGCGPGTLTATLADRWPAARVVGLDSSPDMIREAQAVAQPGRLEFRLGEIEGWRPEPRSVDVIVSNAALQWVPTHVSAFGRWAAALRPGGSLAVQVPTIAGSAATALFRAVATSPQWSGRLGHVVLRSGPQGTTPVRNIDEYADRLADLGLRVNAWETTYLHILPGDDPVLEWFSGTGLRPYLDALAGDEEATARFRAEVGAGLRAAYPRRPYGTILPFRRIFLVAVRP